MPIQNPQFLKVAKIQNRAFSMLELLVVISIIISLLTLGMVALHSMVARSNIRLGQQTVVSALNWARQHAITHRTRCIVELVAIDDNTAARPTPPGTPYSTAAEGADDKLRIIALRSLLMPESGSTKFVLDATVLKEFTLPPALVFDDSKGAARFYPDNVEFECDLDGDRVPDAAKSRRICFEFHPDGTCRTECSDPAGAPGRQNAVRLKDLSTGESSTIYVFPNTGFAKSL